MDTLFEFLFPKLINVAVPLSETDLMIVKSLQSIQKFVDDDLRDFRVKDLKNHLDLPLNTISRRFRMLNYLQISIPLHFLDMGLLGYETYILSHLKPIPDYLRKYCLESFRFPISQFSIFQIPINKIDVSTKIRDEIKPHLFQQMTDRVHSWNLRGLSSGKDGWKISPTFIYGDPSLKVISSQPTMHMSLETKSEIFRGLTSADFKILECICEKGSFGTKKSLSQAAKVSLPEVTRRMKEYLEHRLIRKIYQFFNVGLDITVTFYIINPETCEIPWLDHFLNFPFVDVLYNLFEKSSVFYGHVRLPPKWIKDFIRKIHHLESQFQNLKFHVTLRPADIAKWNLSLSETYSIERS